MFNPPCSRKSFRCQIQTKSLNSLIERKRDRFILFFGQTQYLSVATLYSVVSLLIFFIIVRSAIPYNIIKLKLQFYEIVGFMTFKLNIKQSRRVQARNFVCIDLSIHWYIVPIYLCVDPLRAVLAIQCWWRCTKTHR